MTTEKKNKQEICTRSKTDIEYRYRKGSAEGANKRIRKE